MDRTAEPKLWPHPGRASGDYLIRSLSRHLHQSCNNHRIGHVEMTLDQELDRTLELERDMNLALAGVMAVVGVVSGTWARARV